MGSVVLDGLGQDDVPTDDLRMAYTEKVLEEKELMLRKYIQDNYSKIQNVEKELTGLTLEVKLTAGPKKAALEHLRKLIETATEKIKAAKLKEEQAKKVWEAAAKAVQAEEHNKQRLCEDLKCLVQQSAEAQYSRLEELTRKLEALNPELRGGATQLLAAGIGTHGSTPRQPTGQQPSDNIERTKNKTPEVGGGPDQGGDNASYRKSSNGTGIPTVAAIVASINSHQSPTTLAESFPTTDMASKPDGQLAESDRGQVGDQSPQPVGHGQHVAVPRRQVRRGGRSQVSLVLGRSKSEAERGGWTGAGFDVDVVQT